MQTNTTRRPALAAVAAFVAIATLSLTACSGDASAETEQPAVALPDEPSNGESPDSGSAADAQTPGGETTAVQFAACLMGEGVTSEISELGPVMVQSGAAEMGADGSFRVEEPQDREGRSDAIFNIFSDDGNWVAPLDAYYFEPGHPTGEAWATCVERLGGFTQPILDERLTNRDDFEAQMFADAFEFAADAREAGFYWVADPIDEPSIQLPSWITQVELEALLDAVGNPEHTFMWLGDPGIGFDWIEIISFHPAITPTGFIQQQ